MKSIPVSKIDGPLLDWAAAKVYGFTNIEIVKGKIMIPSPEILGGVVLIWEPSRNWTQGGAIIERAKIEISPCGKKEWKAELKGTIQFGGNPLRAAIRCYVEANTGEIEFSFSDEIWNQLKGVA